MSQHKFLIHPLGAIVESKAKTFHELSLELLTTPGYYFSDSPIGVRQFGSLPTSGEVYLRQQSTLKSAVEELITDDPIIVPINEQGQGAIELHTPIPRGCELTLREIHFEEDPEVRSFNLNGDGPISFEYCGDGQNWNSLVGILQYPLRKFESALIFSQINKIKKVVIYLTPINAVSAIEMFLPGTPQISLSDYFHFKEESFQLFDDDTYRYTWRTGGKKLRAVQLPSGFLNWRIILNFDHQDLILDNKSGIAAADVDAEVITIILIPPDPLRVSLVKTRLYYQKNPIDLQTQINQLKSHLRKAEKEIKRLHQKK
jgi:hypothetical protein